MKSESYRFFFIHYWKKRVKSSTDGCFQAFLTPKMELWASSIFSWHVFQVIGVHLCWIQWSVGTQQPVEGLTVDDKTSLSSRFSGIQPKEPGLSGDEKNLNNFEKSFNKRRDREPNGHWLCREGKVPQGRPSLKPTNPDKVPPSATKAAKGNTILWSDKSKMEHLMLEHPHMRTYSSCTNRISPGELDSACLTYSGINSPAIISRLSTSNQCRCIFFLSMKTIT